MCLATSLAYSQELNIHDIDSLSIKIAYPLMDSAKNRKVLIYQEGCSGCYSLDECGCSDGTIESYLIWQSNAKFKIKTLNCCEDEKNQEIDFGNDLWSQLIEQSVFQTNFKTDYIETHYDFYKVIYLNGSNMEQLLIRSNYLSSKNTYKAYNESQPGYVFWKRLRQEISKIEK